MEKGGQTKRFHYAWVIFACCFLSVFTSLGFGSAPKSLFLAAITENLGISRGLFSISDSCRFITTAVVNLFFGKLVAKFGPRKLIGAGFVCLALSGLISAVSSNVFGFYLANIFLGLGLAWSTTTLVGVVVEKWFTGKKGTIMGFILAANGLGGAIASQILSRIIYAAADGWRTAYFVTAAIMAAIGVGIVLFMRNKPEDVGAHALGEGVTAKKKQRGREWAGIGAREAFRKPYFYLCILCVFLTGMILQGAVGIASAHMKDQGVSAEGVANALSIGLIVLMASKMSTGACFDRFGLRVTMLVSFACSILAVCLLPFVNNGATAILYKSLEAFGLPLETIMLPLIAKECFGQKSYAQLMGLLVSFNTMGYAVGSPLMNTIFDLTGSYSAGFVLMLVCLVFAAAVMQFVISAAHKERERVEELVKI